MNIFALRAAWSQCKQVLIIRSGESMEFQVAYFNGTAFCRMYSSVLGAPAPEAPGPT